MPPEIKREGRSKVTLTTNDFNLTIEPVGPQTLVPARPSRPTPAVIEKRPSLKNMPRGTVEMFTLLTRDLFADEEGSFGPGEDEYWYKIQTQAMKARGIERSVNQEDYRRLGRELKEGGIAPSQVAEVVLQHTPNARVGLRLGSVSTEYYESSREMLEQAIRSYYVPPKKRRGEWRG